VLRGSEMVVGVAHAGSVARFIGSAATQFGRTASRRQGKGVFVSKSVRPSRASMVTSASGKSFFDFSATTLGSGTRESPVSGSSVDFSKYKGKVVMVQNVATL